MARRSFIFLSFLLVSCNNLYHGLTQIPVMPVASGTLPTGLQILYNYPADGENGVEVNRAVLMSLNKDIDPSCVKNGLVTAADASETDVIAGGVQLCNDRIILFKPERDFMPGTNYNILINDDIRDRQGFSIKKGHSWSFRTADPPVELDQTAPDAVDYSPGRGRLFDPKNGITIEFSEDVDPNSFSGIKIRAPGGAEIPYKYKYPYGKPFTIRLDPDVRLADNTTYTVEVAGVADLAIPSNVMTAAVNFEFATGTITDGLVDASNLENGFGTFGDVDGAGILKVGEKLAYKNGNLLVDDYREPEMTLKYVFDDTITGSMGNLTDGKQLTLVINGKNAMTELGLEPKTYDFVSNTIFPTKKEVFIDLYRGKFTIPRPSYWSRMESVNNLVNAEIYEELPYSTMNGLKVSSCKYNLCVYTCDGFPQPEYLFPFGLKNKNFEKGTISIWVKSGSIGISSVLLNIFQISDDFKVYILNTMVPYYNHKIYLKIFNDIKSYDLLSEQLYHIYIIWDRDKRLLGGKSVKIYINGNNISELESNVSLPDLRSVQIFCSILNQSTIYGISEVWLDNLKIWRDVVSDGPDAARWEYENSRDDGLHYIYGPANNYRPEIVKVGYYYVP